MNGANVLPEHELLARRPLPGAERTADGAWRLRWRGTAVMGVVNATPDSFSDGDPRATLEARVGQARAMAAAGALIVDVGGESTRPGAAPVSADEERRRVLPIVERLAEEGATVISVDTRKPEVAADALAAGAHLINDVEGLGCAAMRGACAAAGAPAVVMHMRGDPATMQRDPRYGDVVSEVAAFLEARVREARAAGVPSVLIDPGIGFGKTLEHNLALLRSVARFATLGPPVMVGASRKGMLGALTGVGDAALRDAASIAVHLDAARRGAAMVRAHDVAGHVQALRAQAALLSGEAGTHEGGAGSTGGPG